jgi:hypothetical protein
MSITDQQAVIKCEAILNTELQKNKDDNCSPRINTVISRLLKYSDDMKPVYIEVVPQLNIQQLKVF